MRNLVGARWFLGLSVGLLLIAWLLILAFMDLTTGEVLDMLAASAIGTIGLVFVAQAPASSSRPCPRSSRFAGRWQRASCMPAPRSGAG